MSSIVHDWEGQHGPDGHGPLVTVAGHRFHTVGDGDLLKAVTELKGGTPSDTELEKLLAHKGSEPLDDAQRTLAAAELAVRRSVHDLNRAFKLAHGGDRRDTIMAELQGKDGLFASEGCCRSPFPTPSCTRPTGCRSGTSTRSTSSERAQIHEQLPITANSLASRFDVDTLPASAAVKAHIADASSARSSPATRRRSSPSCTRARVFTGRPVAAAIRQPLGLQQDLIELSSGRRYRAFVLRRRRSGI